MIILCIVQLIPLMQCMLYCIGLFVSWCYLRFYQVLTKMIVFIGSCGLSVL